MLQYNFHCVKIGESRMSNHVATVDSGIVVDTGEFELPETVFIRGIENRVFQSIVLQCLSKIEGIGLIEGNFIDHMLGRRGTEHVKGIVAEQDGKSQSVSIKVEVNIKYGLSIPCKAEEIQAKVSEELTRLSGLHVSSIHVVFKNLLPEGRLKEKHEKASKATEVEAEYTDEL
jgi:uncharacterized alkaline shock family protein YloU